MSSHCVRNALPNAGRIIARSREATDVTLSGRSTCNIANSLQEIISLMNEKICPFGDPLAALSVTGTQSLHKSEPGATCEVANLPRALAAVTSGISAKGSESGGTDLIAFLGPLGPVSA
jgi:hypothetical protein